MFAKLKQALPQAGKKGGPTAEEKAAEKAERDRIAKEEKEAKELEQREALQMKLLPWGFGDYVKMFLFMVIKFPFILAIGLVATAVEVQVKAVNTRSWHRPTFSSGPSCFVTELSEDLFSFNTSINELAIRAGYGPLYNESKLVVGNSSAWFNYTLTETDHCGLDPDHCSIPDKTLDDGNLVEDNGWMNSGHGGIDFGFYFPFASLWMLYKLVWIPLWPVDRIASKCAGNVHPPPQPIFRLVTQPYFQKCTGFMQGLTMILNMLRYVFLPNYLLLPLVSLVPMEHCKPGRVLIHYQMDWIFGQAAYIWLVMDFCTVVVAYAYFKFVKNGQAIGTCAYRLYKTWWLLTCFTSIILFICNLCFTFDWNFFGGLNFAFQMIIDFNMLFKYSVDLLAFMAAANFILESLSMTYLIYGTVLPIIIQTVPCLKPIYNKLYLKADDKASHAEEGRALLGRSS